MLVDPLVIFAADAVGVYLWPEHPMDAKVPWGKGENFKDVKQGKIDILAAFPHFQKDKQSIPRFSHQNWYS